MTTRTTSTTRPRRARKSARPPETLDQVLARHGVSIQDRRCTRWAVDNQLSPQTIYRLRRGLVKPRPGTIAMIAYALDESVDVIQAACDASASAARDAR